MSELRQLGKYRLEANLGKGAFSDVYRATDTSLNHIVALKVLKPTLLDDEEAFARFIQEAQVVAGLNHPHIATVLDLGEADGYYFLALRYVEGSSLDKVLAQHGPLNWRQSMRVTGDVADALVFAHEIGLVHRDVKPQNIIISRHEGAVLTDFGLVKAMEAIGMGSRTGVMLGTPQYIAPEVWHGQPATPASDQYALACVLVEMISGKPLFDAPTPWAIMEKHSEPPDLPPSLTAMPNTLMSILRALSVNPDERFESVADFARDLSQREAD